MDLNTAIQLGEELAKKYNPEGVSPFPFERIEAEHPVRIFMAELSEEISGAVSMKEEGKGFDVFINSGKPATRQHFMIAHALGHYFLHSELIEDEEVILDTEESLHSNRAALPVGESDAGQRELEANYFAAALLMPAEWVVKAWNSLQSVEKCADVFHVSPTAMSLRLERLGLIS